MPDHHLTDDLLLAYAAGSLDESFALVVASHLSLCDDCRATAESFETLGGAVLEAGTEPMAQGALEACLARLDAAPEPRTRRRGRGIFPAPLVDYVGGGLEDVAWRSLGGGVKQAVLATRDKGSVRLLSIPGGTAMPEHGHRGLELTLVLSGAYHDGHARFARGDVDVEDEDHSHTPVAEDGEACICLAATDAPLRFSGLLPRLVQPFIGI